MVLNRVYALLVTDLNREQRDEFDGELYAPIEGWDAAEERLWDHIDEQAEEG